MPLEQGQAELRVQALLSADEMCEVLTIRVELVHSVAARGEVPRADFGYPKHGEEKRQ
jgi:hypothetical protein